jgi:tetratricopeptide (TPR) repeat protein
MPAEDWFRTTAWDAGARADFEARLARARDHNRPQYIKIKAFALLARGDSVAAEELFRRVIDEYPDSLDAAYCAESLGNLYLAAGEFAVAEAHYRRSLQLRPDLNATSGEVHIGLAESLTRQGRHEEALHALEYVPLAKLTLNHSICRWNAALAAAALGVGELQVAAAAAARALALLDAPDQFTRHPGVGRAALPSKEAERLRAVAAGKAKTRSTIRSLLRRR